MSVSKNKSLLVLGIESSCDETAASIVQLHDSNDVKGEILSNIILSQFDEHAEFGGVVPEIAARAHGAHIDTVIQKSIQEAQIEIAEIDAIGATAGPGLMGGLLVGLSAGKALAHALKKPFYAINHLEGHALTARLTNGVEFPYLMLLVSGGHTQILKVSGIGEYERLSTSIDDALGEAFDKTAKLLSLGFPGGPAVEEAASKGDADRFDFPKPLLGKPTLDFSFSGLKTAIRQAANEHAPLDDQTVFDICASFQKTICAILANRLNKALEAHSGMPLVIAGGVAANSAIRATLEETAAKHSTKLIAPPIQLCTDNAAMVAWAAAERLANNKPSDSFDFAARSRWPLDQHAISKIGSGKRGAKA